MIKNVSNVLIALMFFTILHAQEDTVTYDLTNKIYCIDTGVDKADDYNTYLEIYREIRLANGDVFIYHLLEDTFRVVGTYKNIPPNLIIFEIEDSEETKINFEYREEDDIVSMSGIQDSTIHFTLYPVRESEIELSPAITAYLKSERHRAGWNRFHHYLLNFRDYSKESILEGSKHWEPVDYGIIGGE